MGRHGDRQVTSRREILLALPALAACATTGNGMSATPPLVIAHRGASGERPEHTLASYRLAIAQGADFIEPDLVFTKDGVLVCRHENEISGTTDVASRPEFASRRTKKRVDFEDIEGWFTEDFTLAELKTLRCRERLPQLRPANAAFDGQESIPTFEEVCALAKAEGVGVYPETKHPTYFETAGHVFDDALLEALAHHGWRDASAPVFIQSFETTNLKRLRKRTALRLIQLISDEGMPFDLLPSGMGLTYADLVRGEGPKRLAAYVDGIGPFKGLIIPRDSAGRALAPTDLVARAHAAGLKVHPWTFRAENYFLPAELRRGESPAAHGDLDAELRQFYALGVDGVFADFPKIAVAAKS
ncbi:MAG: glycerophosphodiester phosphodiesterase [Hyphomonadaceae bacterium]|nr:glycerophosphodiester phosphodiesterase [Hyphomonadaceae bacterium]